MKSLSEKFEGEEGVSSDIGWTAARSQPERGGHAMAALIPALNSCLRCMTPGEKRFARQLANHLEDDYLCWGI